jgi:hypothetical protein
VWNTGEKVHSTPEIEAVKPPKEPRRRPGVHRTGRNRQFNIRVKIETVERFCKLADTRGLSIAALFEVAVDALEKTWN